MVIGVFMFWTECVFKTYVLIFVGATRIFENQVDMIHPQRTNQTESPISIPTIVTETLNDTNSKEMYLARNETKDSLNATVTSNFTRNDVTQMALNHSSFERMYSYLMKENVSTTPLTSVFETYDGEDATTTETLNITEMDTSALNESLSSNAFNSIGNTMSTLMSTTLYTKHSNDSSSLPGNSDVIDNLADFFEFRLATQLHNYKIFVICALALLGNVLLVFVLCRNKKRSSTKLYLMNLAIWNTILIYIKSVPILSFLSIINVTDIYCKTFSIVHGFISIYAVWILVAMSADRLIQVWFPVKASILCVMKNSILTCLGIGVIILFLMFHKIFTTVVSGRGHTSCNLMHPLDDYWFLVELCLHTFSPLISLVIFSAMLIASVVISPKRIKDIATKDIIASSRERHLTTVVLSFTVSFILLNLPIAIFHIYSRYWYRTNNKENATYFLAREVCYFLSDLHHCLGFLYYMSSSVESRREFCESVSCKSNGECLPDTGQSDRHFQGEKRDVSTQPGCSNVAEEKGQCNATEIDKGAIIDPAMMHKNHPNTNKNSSMCEEGIDECASESIPMTDIEINSGQRLTASESCVITISPNETLDGATSVNSIALSVSQETVATYVDDKDD